MMNTKPTLKPTFPLRRLWLACHRDQYHWAEDGKGKIWFTDIINAREVKKTDWVEYDDGKGCPNHELKLLELESQTKAGLLRLFMQKEIET